MASVDHLYGDCGESIIKEILNTNNVIGAQSRKLYHSVLVIQKSWRGYKIRQDLQLLHAAATKIQKFVRGFLVRNNLPFYIMRCLEQKTNMYYNKMATRIQALWRGYRGKKQLESAQAPTFVSFRALSNNQIDGIDRESIINTQNVKHQQAQSHSKMFQFRKNHQNLRAVFEMRKRVNETNENLRIMLIEEKKRLENVKQLKMEEEAKHLVLYIVFKLHHYLRTYQREGIYSLHGKTKLSRIEDLLNSAKFESYMRLLRSKYYSTYNEVKPKVKIERKKLEEPLYQQKKPFCLYSQPPPKKYTREILTTEKYEAPIVETRFEDKTKHICSKPFDVTKKMVPPKTKVPPYYLDFWSRGCSIHDLDLIE